MMYTIAFLLACGEEEKTQPLYSNSGQSKNDVDDDSGLLPEDTGVVVDDITEPVISFCEDFGLQDSVVVDDLNDSWADNVDFSNANGENGHNYIGTPKINLSNSFTKAQQNGNSGEGGNSGEAGSDHSRAV